MGKFVSVGMKGAKALVGQMGKHAEFFSGNEAAKDKKNMGQWVKETQGMTIWNYLTKTGFYSEWNDREDDE